MEKLQVLNTKGEKVSDINLNKEIWGIEPNDAVLYDALRLARNNFRQGTADTKTRSEESRDMGMSRNPSLRMVMKVCLYECVISFLDCSVRLSLLRFHR